MPELPEVEIIKNNLSSTLIDLTIEDSFQKNISLREPIDDLSLLKNEKIINISRRNKYIILETINFWFIIHLGMTGQLLFTKEMKENKHIHAYIKLNNYFYLYYKDHRRFGLLKIFSKQKYSSISQIPLFRNLGLEPFDKDFNFNKFQSFYHKKMHIKSFLMNSSFVCGIGNIYANEILFLSNVHPSSLVCKIPLKQYESIYNNIHIVLLKAIELGGSSISDFIHINESKGKMQNFYYVYNRANLQCKVCEKKIFSFKQNGRTSFCCNHCQQLFD
jgi:formamidopyrimidine-DNA glycosylase